MNPSNMTVKLMDEFGLAPEMGAEIEFIGFGEPLDLDRTEKAFQSAILYIDHFKREWHPPEYQPWKCVWQTLKPIHLL